MWYLYYTLVWYMPMSGADGGWAVINEETKRKAMARLNRIEGQVQGVQRMVEEEK